MQAWHKAKDMAQSRYYEPAGDRCCNNENHDGHLDMSVFGGSSFLILMPKTTQNSYLMDVRNHRTRQAKNWTLNELKKKNTKGWRN